MTSDPGEPNNLIYLKTHMHSINFMHGIYLKKELILAQIQQGTMSFWSLCVDLNCNKS